MLDSRGPRAIDVSYGDRENSDFSPTKKSSGTGSVGYFVSEFYVDRMKSLWSVLASKTYENHPRKFRCNFWNM